MKAENPDYYLYIFNDNELIEVLSNPDEWSDHDSQLARKILQQRGIVTEGSLLTPKPAKAEHPEGPCPAPFYLMIIGYISSIFVGVGGICIGLYLRYHKKTISNGTQIYAYTKNDRQQGIYMLCLSVAAVIITIIVRQFLMSKIGDFRAN